MPDEESETLTFDDKIVGGRVPREYISSVESGMRHALGGRWPPWLSAFVKVRAELYDGQSHDVDSSNMAFESAGSLAVAYGH